MPVLFTLHRRSSRRGGHREFGGGRSMPVLFTPHRRSSRRGGHREFGGGGSGSAVELASGERASQALTVTSAPYVRVNPKLRYCKYIPYVRNFIDSFGFGFALHTNLQNAIVTSQVHIYIIQKLTLNWEESPINAAIQENSTESRKTGSGKNWYPMFSNLTRSRKAARHVLTVLHFIHSFIDFLFCASQANRVTWLVEFREAHR